MTHPLCMSMEMAILTSTIRHDVCDDLFVTSWLYPCLPPAKHSGLKSAKGNGTNYSIPTLLKHVETTAKKILHYPFQLVAVSGLAPKAASFLRNMTLLVHCRSNLL